MRIIRIILAMLLALGCAALLVGTVIGVSAAIKFVLSHY